METIRLEELYTSARNSKIYTMKEVWKNGRRNLIHPISDFGAVLHIIKGSLGAGMLAMPFAFKNAGLFVGVVGAIVIGFIITHSSCLLVKCSQHLCRTYSIPSLTYADTARISFFYAAEGKLRHLAPYAKGVINTFLFITYYGVNVAYTILVASTFHQVAAEFQFISPDLDVRYFTVGLILFVYPLGIIRTMKFLVPFSAIANASLATGICVIFYYCCSYLPPIETRSFSQPIPRFPIFLSTALFGMEGIGTIMPVENEMKNPSHLLQYPGLLYIGMFVVVTTNIFLGFFGYWHFGDSVLGSISLNLPNDWVSNLVKLSIATGMLLTYGLQMSVSSEVIWNYRSKGDILMERRKRQTDNRNYYIMRSVLICGTVILATALPNLAPIVGFIGACGFSVLGIMMPAVLELTTFSNNDESKLPKWILAKDIVLIMFSLTALVTGSYLNILEALGEQF